MSFPSIVELSYGMEKQETSDQRKALGTLGVLPDGRMYRYCSAGASALSPGLFNTVITIPTPNQTVTIAHAIGTTTVTTAGSGMSADDFKDGYLMVSAGTGAGEVYRIVSSTASSGTLMTVTFETDDGLVTAWATSDTDTQAFVSPYKSLVVNVADAQQAPVCVANFLVTTLYYFWGQVKGLCPLKIDINGGTGGLELDEKAIVASHNHAGQALIVASPAGTVAYWGKPVLGRLVRELDVVDNEMELAFIDLL